MKLISGHYVRTIPAQVGLFGVAAVVTAILIIIAIVQQNVFVLAAVTAVAFVIVLPIETSLGVLAVLVPFDQILVLGNSGVTLAWVAGAFAGATLVFYGLVSGRFQSPPRAGLYWGLFVLWTATSTVWAIDPAISLKQLPTVVALFGVYIVAASLRVTRQELSRILLLAVAGGAVAASVIIFQFAHHLSFEGRATLVVGNIEANPNELATSLLLPFSLALCGVWQRESLLKRVGLLAALTLITTSILLAMSRGSLIALAATLLVCLFRVGVHRRVLLPILVLAIPLLFLPSLFYQRMEEASADRGTGRYDIWLAGLEIVKRYPVIGAGLANFPVAYQKVAGYAHVFPSRGYVRDAHNMYLQVWAEMGAIGFAFFLAAIWSQMKEAHSALSSRGSWDYSGIAIEAACWGQLVAGLSGNIQWNKPFWFAFILLALFTQQRRESELNGLPAHVGSAESTRLSRASGVRLCAE
jgi:O-antigen ligase